MKSLTNFYKKCCDLVSQLSKMKYFSEIYIGIIALITILGWMFSSYAGMAVIIVITIAVVILIKDFKYIIPNLVYFIFCLNKGFQNNEFPIPIFILGGALVFVLAVVGFKNKIKLSKMHSFYGLLGLAIANLLPIFWCNTIPQEYNIYYVMFFANLAYFIFYVILVNGIKKNSIRFLAITMSYLAVILTFECLFKTFEELNINSLAELANIDISEVFKLWYYIGWGLCNEAGLMICFSLPFTFYLLMTSKSVKDMFFQNIKVFIGLVGLILSNSRGAYLCGFFEVIVLYLALLFVSNKPRMHRNFFLGLGLCIIGTVLIFKDQTISLIDKAMDAVFKEGLDDNGRIDLWTKSFNSWGQNTLTKMFGPGFCAVFEERMTAGGVQSTPVIFHSTFFETLAVGGIFGISMLLLHLYEKYRNLLRCDKTVILTFGTAIACVGAYGIIDNTYHMYYFMLPLVVVLAVIDVSLPPKEVKQLF